MPKRDRARENGLKALKTVEKVLTQVGWEPMKTDLEGVLRVDFGGDNIPIAEALADVRIDTERFLYYLNFRDRAPARNRNQTMQFITRANFDFVIGNFELNLDDGCVRFKSSVDFTEAELSETLIRNAILCAMDAIERYAEVLVEVMQGKKKAMEAIKDAEGNGE
jgi:Putative bacterial sensory transduction regulator